MKRLAHTGLFLAFFIVLSGCSPRDDTDPPRGRSGLRLFTDNMTGCQYLGNPFGGITPRVDREGRHICTTDR